MDRIFSIIVANLDPSLDAYLHTPPTLATASIALPPLLERALLEDEEFQQEVIQYQK